MTVTSTFYYDLGSPYAYLSAERLARFPAPRWQPILLGGLFAVNGRSSWARADPAARASGIAEVERRAHEYGLAPVRWPEPWPSDYLTAMRAATFAFREGSDAGRRFTLRAFRAAFQEGRDLAQREVVLDVGEETGFTRAQLEAALGDGAIKLALREATEAAHARSVSGVPTVAVGGELFWGDDRLGEALAMSPT